MGAGVEVLESRVLMAVNDPYISEFVANNNTGLLDDSSPTPVRSDWIEIANPGTVAVNLAGWHLTDSKGQPSKWSFPSSNATATTVPAGGYLVVFADGSLPANYIGPGGKLHTNFSLSNDGEYLAITRPDNTAVNFFDPFPQAVGGHLVRAWPRRRRRRIRW